MEKGKEGRPKACKSHKEVKERLKIIEKSRNKERKRKAPTEERIIYLTEKYTRQQGMVCGESKQD